MATIPMTESVTVTLDSSGNGTVTLGPIYSGQIWMPTTIGTTVSSNTAEPTFKAFNSRTPSPTTYLGGTYTGSNDSDDITNVVLHIGQVICGQYTGGDPGAQATMTLIGTMEVPG